MARRKARLDAGRALAREDTWENAYTGIGVRGRDKRTGATVVPVELSYKQNEDLYRGDDLGAKIVEEPAREMTRRWAEVQVPGKKDASEATDGRLEELEVQERLRLALTWERAYGGSAILVLARDGSLDQAQPLRENAIETIEGLTVLDRQDLRPASYYTDPTRPRFGEPETYELNPYGATRQGWGTRVHESRVIRFPGIQVSRQHVARMDGWGDSVFVRVFRVLADFGMTWGGASYVMQDLAQLVVKMRGLAELVAAGEWETVKARLEAIELGRSVLRAVVLDAGDGTESDPGEDAERKTTSLAGLPEMLDRFMTRLAAAADMPVSRLFGIAPSGLNNSDKTGEVWWTERIEALQNERLRRPAERLVRLVFLSKDGPTKGVEPESWSLNFRPLRQLTSLEEAQLRKTVAEADAAWVNVGVLVPAEVAKSRFGGDRFSMETELDEGERAKAEVMERDRLALERARLEAGQRQPGAEPEGSDDNASDERGPGARSDAHPGRFRGGALDRDRPVAVEVRAALARTFAQALTRERDRLVAWAKGLPPPPERADASDWKDPPEPDLGELEEGVASHLEAVSTDAAKEGLQQVDAELLELLSQANARAIEWAREHAGELVTAVEETTREGIRDLVANALEEGLSNDELAEEIRSSYAFSDERAEMIARTETAFADVHGNVIGWEESGVVAEKEWIVAQSDFCPLCAAMQGKRVPLDQEFEDGDPPLHPNCRCDVLPVLAAAAAPAASAIPPEYPGTYGPFPFKPEEERVVAKGTGLHWLAEETSVAVPGASYKPQAINPSTGKPFAGEKFGPFPAPGPATPAVPSAASKPKKTGPGYVQAMTGELNPVAKKAKGWKWTGWAPDGKPIYAPPAAAPPPPPTAPSATFAPTAPVPTTAPSPVVAAAPPRAVEPLPVPRAEAHTALGYEDAVAWHAEHAAAARRWRDALPGNEKRALGSYQGSGYSSMNGQLRHGRVHDKAEIEFASRAIDMAPPLPRDVWVWRGFRFDELAQRPLEFLSKNGTIIEDKGFVSSSIHASRATGFAGSSPSTSVLVHIRVPAGTRAPYLTGSGTSAYEYEILLQRGAEFRVTKVYKTKDGYTVLEAEYLGSKKPRFDKKAEQAQKKRADAKTKKRADKFTWSEGDVTFKKP